MECMESIVKNSITGQIEEAENFCLQWQVTCKLKTETQAEHMSVDANVGSLDIGVGQVPKAVI